jgi:epoxyqueuosine reductase
MPSMADNIENYSQLHLLPNSIYRYRTVSVEHLQDMQDYMDKLRHAGLFCNNKVFNSYVDNKGFRLPENFQEAKSLIVIAIYNPLAKVSIPFQGRIHEVLIPPNYRVDEFTIDQLRATIVQNIIREKGYRVESVGNSIFLKHLATRSGLAEYGRNNICYVEGMGSMLTLYAFFTDFIFEEHHWGDIRMMDSCRDCKVCINQCPTQAISDKRFVIDVNRCLPLYNEIIGEIPAWILKQSHNALIGCMRCQLRCPANKEVVLRMIELEGLTEIETSSILEGNINDDAAKALCQKLKVATPDIVAQMLPVFSRNLKMLIKEA